MKLSSSGFLCAKSVLIAALILPAVIGLFRLSASSSFSFGRLHLSKKFSVSPRFSNFLAYHSS